MVHSQGKPSFTFGGSGLYRIVVQGLLDPSDADRLGGMTITTHTDEGQPPISTLAGRLKDQAQLSGILNTLYEMHLTIVTVQALGEGEDGDEIHTNGN